ncbi:MAG: hypothetical protein R2883_06895 [Caldisericia bacterium]
MDLRAFAGKPDAMFNFFATSQSRTGYMTVWYPPYIPKMEVDEENPLEKALEELYTEEWVNSFNSNTEVVILEKLSIGLSNGQ